MTILFGTAGIPLSCPQRSYKAGLKTLSKLGLKALEIQFPRGVRMKGDTALDIKNQSRERRLKISTHAPHYINFNTKSRRKIENTYFHFTETVEIAKLLGSNLIIFNPGFYSRKHSKSAVFNVKNNLNKLREDLDSKGLDHIILGPKTTGRKKQFGTEEEIISICSEIERTKPIIDFGHIYARREMPVDKKNAYLSTFYKIERNLGSEYLKDLYMRFTAVEAREGNEIRHMILGFGKPKFEDLAQTIKNLDISGTIISKSPILEEDAIKMKRIYESKNC